MADYSVYGNPDQVRQFADLIMKQRDKKPDKIHIDDQDWQYLGSLAEGHSFHAPSYHVVESSAVDLEVLAEMRTPPDRELYTEQTVDDLGKVRDTIMERGWIQGYAKSPDGVCLLGGVGVTVGWHTHRQLILRVVLETYLGSLVGLGRLNVPAWNDSDGRTFDEVIKVLDGCIVWVKEKING